ncbi:pyruvate kinase [bacterium]|nr:MAG: pyruvate kinase [bacterium]RIK59872.1 MAG: pyruvate kinase [Planctomycetota bacterium]
MANFTRRTLRGQPQRTKIVCTLGPASCTPEVVGAMMDAGMSVARLNFSHGSFETQRASFELVRRIAAEKKRSIAIMADLSGPKIRCRDIEGGQMVLGAGERIDIVRGEHAGSRRELTTTYEKLVDDVEVGDPIYLDDGSIRLQVIEKQRDRLAARVEVGGVLKSRKGINLPGSRVSAPSLTEKDARDLEFAAALGVDFFALSFVRSAADIQDLKQRLARLSCPARVIAKIEKPAALDELDAIIEAADGVMVARGDLGIELPVEKVPLIQKRIIRAARHALKPVIVATQMLESMIEHPTPTRAEVSDIANAIEDGGDAVMLSAETASGKYPVQAVRTMASVARDVETEYAEKVLASGFIEETLGDPLRKAMVMGAAMIAEALKAKFIVVRSESGETARYLSKIRGRCPIIAVHPDDAVLRRHALFWGVLAVQTDASGSVQFGADAELKYLAGAILDQGLVLPQDAVIVVSRYPWGEQQPPNSIRAIVVGEAAGLQG